MKITVKAKNVEISIDDSDNSSVIKYESYNLEAQKIIEKICNECIKLLKETN